MKLKSIGIVRRVDDLGRFVIPKELRDSMDIKIRDPLEVYVAEGGLIVLKKYERGCVLCGESEGLKYVSERPVCAGCRESMKE